MAVATLAVLLAGCGQTPAQPSAAAPSTWLETQAPSTSYEALPTSKSAEPTRTASPTATRKSTAATSTAASSNTSAPSRGANGRLTVTAALADIPTKGRAPRTGYERDEFGSGWKDTDHNGCDSRNDILTRDLTHRTYKPGTHECVVLTGVLKDPYTGTTISFTRGVGTSTAVQIDHVVALSDAWQKGAQGLSADTREELANDPLNLLAVDGPTNGGKSDGDAATWLPPRAAFRCDYVARQTAVKLKYGLWMTSAEKSAIRRVVSTCPTETIPAS